MSKQVDERVVSMQFDNKHFEANIATTMSTLDKFKQKLNLSGAAKGLNDIDTAAKKVDMSGLGAGIETVRTKFSALEVMGVTALANITNSAVNAGKRIASALTIDPIKTGFQEYETQMNSIQTILANTQSKGSTLDDVNKALDTLNTYADKTIYNFTEMTRNIGTFTAAGVDLQTSVDSIQGIANLAAVSGSSSQQASTAMYQLSQALAAGRVSLMDWNSVVNAGMGGELFQNALIRTSELLKTGAKDAINTYGSFRESLTKGEWLTTEVLTETLKQLSGAYSEADLIAQGFTKEQAKEITQLANTATAAAIEVKTFTQLWDVMKESAQSGWAQTWKLVVGDFEEAKALLTPIADFFTGDNGIITKMSETRNALLEGILDFSSPWEKITEKLNAAGLGKIKETLDTVEKATDKLKYFQDVVNDVWRGDYKNSDTGRFELLKKAGYDDRVVQDLVNKGNGYKLTMKDVEESHKKFGLTMSETTKKTKETTAQFEKLSNEQLKNAGLTDSEIKLYNDLAEEAERTGVSIGELVDKMSKKDGRTLLIDSLKNAGSGVIGVFTAMKNAWSEIFPAPSVVRIYNIIDAINQFSEKLRLTDKDTGELNETAKKMQRTFKGVFAALDIVLTLVGGPLKIAFKAFTQLLGMFDLDILDVTADIGDAIVKFRDWIDSTLDFTAVFEKIIPPIKNAYAAIKEWIDGIKDAENVPKYIADGIMNGFGKIGSFLSETLSNLWSMITQGFSGAPGDMASGFINGVRSVAGIIGQTLIELGTQILEKFRAVLGIHSPSTETYSDGRNFILGFWEGLKALAGFVWDFISTFANKCLGILKELDLGKVIAVAMSGGLLFFLIKLGKALDAFTSPLEGLGDILDNTATAIKNFSGVLKSVKKAIAAQAFKTVAISIAILAGALVVLSLVPADKLLIAAGVLVAISTAMIFMMNAITKMGEGADLKLAKFAGLMLAMAGAIAILAIVVKMLSGMTDPELEMAVIGLGVLITAIGLLTAISRFGGEGVGKDLLLMAGAIAVLVMVMKALAKIDDEAMKKAETRLIFLVEIIGVLTVISMIDSNSIGKTLMQMAGAMAILVIVMKMLSNMEWSEMGKAAVGLLGLVGIMALLTTVSKIGGKDVGKNLILMAGAMGILAMTAKIIASMDWDEMAKAGVGLVALSGIIVGLVAATRLAGGNDLKGVASTLLAMSISIGILAAVAVLLSLMDVASLAKGIIAIGMLAAIMSMMVVATKNAQDCKSNLIVMTVAIGVMTAAVIALSFIDPARLAGATVAMGILMGMFALMTKMACSAKKSMGTLAVMTLVVGALAGILYLMSKLDVKNSIGNAIALSSLIVALSVASAVLSKFGSSTTKVLKGALGLTALVGVLALIGLVLAMMSALNVKNAIENALVLSGLMIVLTGVSVALALIGAAATNILMGALGLAALVGVMALIGLVLAMMSALHVGDAVKNALVLSGLLVVLTGVSVVLALIGALATSILMGALGLAALVGVMALLGLVLAMMSALNVKNAVENALVLSGLIVVLTGVAVVLALIGALATSILLGAVGLSALTVVLALIGLVLAMMSTLNVENAIENATALMGLLTVMGDVCFKMALVGPLALMGVAAIAALTYLMIAVGGLAVAIGDLMEKSPQLQSFLDTGIPVLEQLARAVGSLMGNLIDGFLTSATAGLPEIGNTLSKFIENAMPFIEGVKLVNDDVINGVKGLATAVIALTAADLISGVATFLSGGSSFASLGTELSLFMSNAMPFIVGSKLLNADAMEGAKALAEMILILTAADVLQGLTSWFTGESSIGDFGGQLEPLGQGLQRFSNAVIDVNPEKVKAAADSLKILAETASAIPNTGGLIAELTGDNTADVFGDSLPALGEGLQKFSNAVTDVDSEKVKSAAEAVKALAETASAIPNAGGLIAAFTGDNAADVFGNELPALGKGLKAFSDEVTDIDGEAVKAGAEAGKSLAEMASAIPNAGGLWAEFFGDNSMADFGDELVALGEGLKGFSDEVGGLEVEAVSTATKAVKTITDMAKLAPENLTNLTTFGVDLPTFGGHLKEYFDAVKGITDAAINASTKAFDAVKNISGSIDSAKTSKVASAVDDLVDAIRKMSKVKGNTADNFSNALKKLGETNIDSLVKAFKNAGPKIKTAAENLVSKFIDGIDSQKSKVNKSGSAMVEEFKKGIKSKESTAKNTCTSLVSACATAIRTSSSGFYSAGADLVTGFANGISANTYLATAKAKAMADAAEQAAKDALDINSPSKVFRALGYSVPEGFAMGIDRMLGLVSGSSRSMADTAINSVSSAISKVADYVNEGIDAQPTIRPVLDLSDVKSQAGSISGLFSMRPSVGVLSNVGAISSMMNSRHAGTTDDVISAIDDLRKSLGNTSGDQYNINGVTYDDGSNVSEAVRSLVRAARIERRI